ncbi:MAG: VOC family protein [Caulobacterales bacterium]|nr:VOC family protein [Caulobacterales bacterium]
MTDAARPPQVRLQRANYLVADLDRALSFYRDVLGFKVAFVKESAPTSYSYPVFEIPRDAALRFAVLSAPGQPRVMALTEVRGADLPPLGAPRRAAIVLDTPDVDAVVAGARGLGLTVYEEEALVTNDGRTGREVGIVDADGNLVVIYTITGRAP